MFAIVLDHGTARVIAPARPKADGSGERAPAHARREDTAPAPAYGHRVRHLSLMPPPTRAPGGPGCELVSDGLLAESVSAWTSLAFVVAGVRVLLRARRGTARGSAGQGPGGDVRRVLGYAALVAAVGMGSVVQHGPDPAWSDVAHDLPLLTTLAFIGADAAADLTGRPRAWRWWALPSAALLPLIVLAPRPGDVAQVGVAAFAVVLTLLRAVARPGLRRRIGAALALLALGGMIGTLSRAGWPWCDPTSLLQGHAVWHVLAAAALVVLAPTVGARARSVDYGAGRRR